MYFFIIGLLLLYCPIRVARLKYRAALLLFSAGFLGYVISAVNYNFTQSYFEKSQALSLMLFCVPCFYLLGCYAWYVSYLEAAEKAARSTRKAISNPRKRAANKEHAKRVKSR